ncbi:citrate synthase family protein [Diaphorobacter ruginosibacter]|uniref:citrate synthase (unknown stereospecificity) n=2 Tax=Diaphorobacter ruginosibacter TaxID=1715720 RepID=A0A7G9RVM4_9BURK|nr:citrate synthase family protein [Diaphorobacter ruginosibacter]
MAAPGPADPAETPWISAEQAASMLGVKRSSLYSYVSRGLLRAQRLPQHRGSSYMLADVARLARQRSAIRNPSKVAQSALDWGQAVLPSSITLVKDGQFHYRGRNAVALAERATLEETAALLWQCASADMPQSPTCPQQDAQVAVPPGRLPEPEAVLGHWHRLSLEPGVLPQADGASSMAQDMARNMALVHRMCAALLGLPHDMPAVGSMPVHRILQRHWKLDDHAADLLRRALVLCADHELNASTFAVRVVASTGAQLHASLGAGLAALSGPRHGGMTQLIDAHWDEWHGGGDRQQEHSGSPPPISPHLQGLLHETQTGSTPSYCAGFGHPLYPDGDPRSMALIAAMPPLPAVRRLTATVLQQTGLHPSLDYALVAVQRSLGLPQGAAFLLFALGRTVGWIAHAREQSESGQLIRPRAIYAAGEAELENAPAKAQPLPSSRMVRFR